LLLFLVLMLIGFYTYAQTETSGQAQFRYTFENRSYFNGLTFAIYAFYFGVILLLPIFAALEGGSQIAGEAAGGTLGLILTRPISRRRLFFNKIGMSMCFVTLIVGGFLATALLIGLVAVGWGDLSLYPGVLQMTDRPQHLSQGQALRAFALAWPAATLAVLAPLCLSYWISSWSRSPVNAVGVSISVYLVLYLISEVHFFRELRPYLFTSYASYWRGLFRSAIAWTDVGHNAAKLLSFSLLFMGLAYHRFCTREIVP
jgi:ABC-2 type transport system permease protein